MMEADTIAAVSTPPGEGGIGIVRLSGPEAFAIARRVFRPSGPGELVSHRLRHGFVVDPATGEKLDEVLLAPMLAAGTYTREDVVEINCHGGLVPVRRVLELAIREGARLAEPGEFTKRAFLNGRIDLSQAEAALDLIRAKTASAERMAMEQLEGGLSKRVGSVLGRVRDFCAHLEAYIDFPEEEIEPAPLSEIKGGLRVAEEEARALSASFEDGRLFREGIRAVIAGRPNVGKSSLLNALLSEDRAIVTEMPGTTRDVLEEFASIKGLPMRIVDTAGIRQARDMAEEEGVRRTLRAMEGADVILGMLDASGPLHEGDRELLERIAGRNAVVVLNKCDLPRGLKMEAPPGSARVVEVSARTGAGLEALRDAIYELSIKDPSALAEGVVVTNLRHRLSLDRAAEGLEAALTALEEGRPLEIAAMEMREALDALGEIVGAVTTEDILDRIFGEFCIGK
ncbi:MAG: tRNA uridine-5-carboxymethylaminomethyl(34) synthesis GTPase MnmE [Nitrospirota bacterium]|jgi:tRNA modification GTPase